MTDLSLTSSITIDAPIEDVWRAVTTPALIKQWFFGVDTETDWNVGSPLVHRGEYGGKPYEDRGEILQFDPPKLLVHTHWSDLSGKPDSPEHYQEVSWALAQRNGATRAHDHRAQPSVGGGQGGLRGELANGAREPEKRPRDLGTRPPPSRGGEMTNERRAHREAVALRPLEVSKANPRYFTVAIGRRGRQGGRLPDRLAHLEQLPRRHGPGSDCAETPEQLDFDAYLAFLEDHGHNFIRLWRWEQFKSQAAGGDFHLCMTPQPWPRTGPGEAKDGKPKFDLSTVR